MITGTKNIGPCECCSTANCGCSCPNPSYGPVSESFPTPPGHATVCDPTYSGSEGYEGHWLGTYSASTLLDPCASPFPPPPDPNNSTTNPCGLPASNWRNSDENGCDLDWVADGAASYIASNCSIRVWFAGTYRSNWAERSGDAGCECISTAGTNDYEYRLYVLNCATGNWEDKTSTLVKRSRYQICQKTQYSFGGADCSNFTPVEPLAYDPPRPPATLGGCVASSSSASSSNAFP
jgi:hypothetical protein